MRILRIISLLLAFGVVFAHSVFPHHHHTEPHKATQAHDIDHDHDSDHDHDDHHDQDEHSHSAFTFSQIEHVFLTGKHITVSISIAAVVEVFVWTIVADPYNERQFYITDFTIPPLITHGSHYFRGPPQV